MINLLPKAILYPLVGMCCFSAYLQYGYIRDWLVNPDSPVRNEFFTGVFLVGFISAPIWIGTVALVFWKSEIFKPADRGFAILSALAVFIGTVSPFLIELIF